jgi:hypothetical protein
MIIPESVPTVAALALAAGGLAAGVAFGRISVRDQLRQVRRLLPTVMTYARKGDEAYAAARAITSPTVAVPVAELLADSRSPRERFRDSWRNGIERARRLADDLRPEPEHIGATAEDGLGLQALAAPVADTTPAPAPAAPADDPSDTIIFQRLIADFYGSDPGVLTMPAQQSPWQQPEIKHAPRGPQQAPKWEVRPAPPRRRQSLLGLVAPTVPGQRTRLPHDPRRLAMLDNDPTRAFRTKVVSA